jgi:hypothetical protein
MFHVLALLAAAQPQPTAPEPCILAQLDRETTAAIAAHIAAGPTAEAASGSAGRYNQMFAKVTAAASRCAGPARWSAEQTKAAAALAIVSISQASVEERLRAFQIAPEALARAVAALSPDERQAVTEGGEGASDAVVALLNNLTSEGRTVFTTEMPAAEQVGIYAGLLIYRDRLRDAFSTL